MGVVTGTVLGDTEVTAGAAKLKLTALLTLLSEFVTVSEEIPLVGGCMGGTVSVMDVADHEAKVVTTTSVVADVKVTLLESCTKVPNSLPRIVMENPPPVAPVEGFTLASCGLSHTGPE